NNKPASASYSNGMTATWTYNADGSLHEIVYNGIVGARYTASETLYANGKPVSAVWTNGSTVMQTETWNADGTVHDIHYYGLTGAYADYEVIYANNKPASATYSNGMTQAWNYNADGSLHEVVYNGIAGARYTSSETLYANGKPVSAVWTNGATVMQTQAWNADGTVHDIHYYGLTGAYTDYDVLYANNKPASATYSNGMTASWSYNADGSLHEVVYDGIAGARYTSSETLYANGKPVSAVWTNGETVMQTQTWNADGTVHDVHYYGLTGAYSDYDVVYANNKPASASYSNGMTQSWGYNADGSLHEVVYNGIVGQPWTSSETFYENGKPVSAVWTTGDATSQSEAATIVRSQTWNADGSVHDIHYFGITGQAYTDYDVIYANNKPVSALYSNGMTQTWTYNSDGSSVISFDNVEGKSYTATASIYDPHNDVSGHLALQQVTNTNGTQTLRSYDDGLTVTIGSAGANVQLPGASGNAFHFDFKPETAVTGSTGADNLVLQSGFGHVTVTAFGLESGAGTNNDVVTISGGAFKDFADMLAHASQDAAGNTHITDAAGDVLTLSHVSIAALQPNHFIIT
ncbi:MAG TPA: hypothetical protein VFL49_00265, partial [Pseudolabrys sp.]|nr:hypothetical protein [Pseudolabrys sp.]